MPTVFVPRVPLRPVERHVDFQAHHDHVTDRRAAVEKAALPSARRLAYATAVHGLPPVVQQDRIAARLGAALEQTAVFGFRQVRRELEDHRGGPVTAAYAVPDTDAYSRTARAGIDQVKDHVRRRAKDAAAATVQAARDAYTAAKDLPQPERVAAVTAAVKRTLHNTTLELVGETLNLGRASGAMSLPNPPEFALRSEQLDKTTCEICDGLHGTIVQVDTSEFYDYMPPAGCLGGGRCRGLYIYGDSTESMAAAA